MQVEDDTACGLTEHTVHWPPRSQGNQRLCQDTVSFWGSEPARERQVSRGAPLASTTGLVKASLRYQHQHIRSNASQMFNASRTVVKIQMMML